MNSLGLSMILKMGCFCSRESVDINGFRYSVEDRLGEGGFSTVDLVESRSSKQRFALKRILCHSVEDQKRVQLEVDYYKKLRHPNVIELVDFAVKGTADIVTNQTAEAFILLPFYRRGTLHDHLALKSFNRNHLEAGEVLRLFAEICKGVKYMHDFQPEPIAHRDLKTANVCLSEDLTPILMDLGSCAPAKVQICGAQDAQRLQDIAAEKCSMTYRAPELFHVESYCLIDQRTDIWSLGCILYALCYFKSPYDVVHEKGDSVNLAVISGTVHFPEDTPYDQVMHDFINFMLKVTPQDRPFIDDVIEKLDTVRHTIETVA